MPNRPETRQKTERQQRLSAALRENLKRRKAQAKGRKASARQEEQSSHDSAGIPDNNEISRPR